MLLKVLTEQFNNLRDRQPIIMDALLETIEQLKEMKKKYDYLFLFCIAMRKTYFCIIMITKMN